MTPYWSHGDVTLYPGDCREVLPHLPAASVDAIACDPPYEIAFMGRAWDSAGVAFDPATWAACLRVLKPGGHLLAFGGTRTWHRMVCAIEDAGFEIRDSIHWIYGSGFPKSLDVSKAIDKAAGAEREVVATIPDRWAGKGSVLQRATQGERSEAQITTPATDDARHWQGWGTALKPAHEPIVVARKPLAGTVAANVLAHGTGALNIDGCRVAAGQDYRDKCASVVGLGSNRNGDAYGEWTGVREDSAHEAGRWPTNIVLTHSAACNDGPCVQDCPVAELDQQNGNRPSGGRAWNDGDKDTEAWRRAEGRNDIPTRSAYQRSGDSGGASRYFPTFRYEAKASASERPRGEDGTAHVTVKPLALMRWLVRLVTPPGGVCLDPFLGSGTTAEACLIEGLRCIGVEKDAAHLPLIKARLSKPIQPTIGGTP